MQHVSLSGVLGAAPVDSAKYQRVAPVPTVEGVEYRRHVYYADGRCYTFGMIDILQGYTCEKIGEGCIKRSHANHCIHCVRCSRLIIASCSRCICKGDGISCRPPEAYARRFEEFCETKLFRKVMPNGNPRGEAMDRVTESLAAMASLTSQIT